MHLATAHGLIRGLIRLHTEPLFFWPTAWTYLSYFSIPALTVTGVQGRDLQHLGVIGGFILRAQHSDQDLLGAWVSSEQMIECC